MAFTQSNFLDVVTLTLTNKTFISQSTLTTQTWFSYSFLNAIISFLVDVASTLACACLL